MLVSGWASDWADEPMIFRDERQLTRLDAEGNFTGTVDNSGKGELIAVVDETLSQKRRREAEAQRAAAAAEAKAEDAEKERDGKPD